MNIKMDGKWMFIHGHFALPEWLQKLGQIDPESQVRGGDMVRAAESRGGRSQKGTQQTALKQLVNGLLFGPFLGRVSGFVEPWFVLVKNVQCDLLDRLRK